MKRKIVVLTVAMFGYVVTTFAQFDGMEPKGTLVSVEEKTMGFVMKTENYIDVEEDKIVHYLVVAFDGEMSSIYVMNCPIADIKSVHCGGNLLSLDFKDESEFIQKKYGKDEQSEETIKGYKEFNFDKADVCKKVASEIQSKLTALESTYYVPTSEMEHSFVYGQKDFLQIVEWNGTLIKSVETGKYKFETYLDIDESSEHFELYTAAYEIGKPEIISVDNYSINFEFVTKINVANKSCYINTIDGFLVYMRFFPDKSEVSDMKLSIISYDFETEEEAEQCRQKCQAALDAYKKKIEVTK